MAEPGTWGAQESKTWGEAFPDRWRVAIIGAGPRAHAMARIWGERSDVEIVGLCDPVPESIEPVAAALKVNWFTDLALMLKQEPHIIINATRTPLHYALTLLALEAPGVRCVIVEKPIADTVAHAYRLCDLAEQRGIVLLACHQTSCTPPVTKALQMVNDGAIGDLERVTIQGKGYFAGYELFSVFPHYLNIALLFAGPVVKVAATASDTEVLHLPYQFGLSFGPNIAAQLETLSGVPIQLTLNQAPKPSADTMAVELYGTKGALQLYRRWWLHQKNAFDQWEPVEIPDSERILNGHDYKDRQGGDDWMAEMTMQRLRGETFTHPCAGFMAAHGLQVIHGILESAYMKSSLPVNGQHSAFQLPAAPDPRLAVLRYREWATRKEWLRV